MHTLASASIVQQPISEEFDYTSGPTLVTVSHKLVSRLSIQKKGYVEWSGSWFVPQRFDSLWEPT